MQITCTRAVADVEEDDDGISGGRPGLPALPPNPAAPLVGVSALGMFLPCCCRLSVSSALAAA
eukprot:COSAG05_NODE_1271_length_5315_cov_2.397738_4_plen_63_part_00